MVRVSSCAPQSVYIHTLFLVGTARYAIRAGFSGVAAGQNRSAGLEIRYVRFARARTSQRDVPTIFRIARGCAPHALRVRTVRCDTKATNPQSIKNAAASARIRFGQFTTLVLSACS